MVRRLLFVPRGVPGPDRWNGRRRQPRRHRPVSPCSDRSLQAAAPKPRRRTSCRTRSSPNMLDTYAIVQAQRALTIADEQLRHLRRAAEEAPGHPAPESASAPSDGARARPDGGAAGARSGRRDRDPQPADGASRARRARRASSCDRRTTRSTRSSIPGSRRASGCSRSRSSGASWTCSSARESGRFRNSAAAELARASIPAGPAGLQAPLVPDGPFRAESVYNCGMALRLRSGVCVGLSLAAVTLASAGLRARRRGLTKQDADRCPGQARSHHGLRHVRRRRGRRPRDAAPPRRRRSSPTPS